MKYLLFLLLLFSCAETTDTAKQSTGKKAGSVNMLSDTAKKYISVKNTKRYLPGWSKENRVVVHVLNDPPNLHPTNGTSSMRNLINQYTQLFIVSNDLEKLSLRPGVVRSLPDVSDDQLKFTFALREDIFWDDGSPLTVEDIAFTIKANKCPLVDNPYGKAYFRNVQDIVTYEDQPEKFTVVMAKPYVQNISILTGTPVLQRSFYDSGNLLSGYSIPQMNAEGFNPDNEKELVEWASEFNSSKYGRDPEFMNGLGPYFVERWEDGQQLVLQKKAEHWTYALKKPSVYENAYPEKIIFKVNKDQNTQVLEFRSQTIDVSATLSTKALMSLREEEEFNINYHSEFVSRFGYSYMALNMKPDGVNRNKFFNDTKTRWAAAYLTPVQDIIDLLHFGKNKRVTGPVSFLKDDFNPELKPVAYDVEKARRLLEEAGWTDTDGDNIREKEIDGERLKFEVDLHYMNSQTEWRDIAQIISESMEEAGIKVNPVPLDFSVLYEKAANHDFDMMLGAWSGNMHPDDHTQLWHASSWATNGDNYPGFGNVTTDALIDSINSTFDFEKRKALSYKFQKMVYDQQPYVFLWSSNRKVIVHKRFGNVNLYYERPGILLNNLKLLFPARPSRSKTAVAG